MTEHALTKYATTQRYFEERDGQLLIGGIPISQIVETYKTPAYVYDFSIIQKQYQILQNIFPQFEIFFSLKANPSLAVCNFLQKMGCGAEIASGGELEVSLAAGVQPSKIVFAGPAKTDAELEAAVDAAIASVNVESFAELHRLEKIAKSKNKRIDACLRVNTTVAQVDAAEVMVGGASRFGIDQENIFDQWKQISLEYVSLVGIHLYTASQILEVDGIVRNLQRTLEFARSLKNKLGYPIEIIDFGGGLGVPYLPMENELDVATLTQEVASTMADYPEFSLTRCILELGRFLVAQSGVFLTKVIDIKQSRGKFFIATDGGMNHFTRPIFMDLNHPTLIANKLNQPESIRANIGGPICTPLDVYSKEITVPDVEPGDIVAIFNAGAYGYSMSMLNFLTHPNPPEIVVFDGKTRLVRQRGSIKNMIEVQQVINID